MPTPETNRVVIRQLLTGCPLGGNPAACQGHAVRNLRPADQEEWLRKQSDAEMTLFIEHHVACMINRLRESGRHAPPEHPGPV